jgi:hypothetical protein
MTATLDGRRQQSVGMAQWSALWQVSQNREPRSPRYSSRRRRRQSRREMIDERPFHRCGMSGCVGGPKAFRPSLQTPLTPPVTRTREPPVHTSPRPLRLHPGAVRDCLRRNISSRTDDEVCGGPLVATTCSWFRPVWAQVCRARGRSTRNTAATAPPQLAPQGEQPEQADRRRSVLVGVGPPRRGDAARRRCEERSALDVRNWLVIPWQMDTDRHGHAGWRRASPSGGGRAVASTRGTP